MTSTLILEYKGYTLTRIYRVGHPTSVKISKGNVSDYSKFVPHNFSNITNIEKAKKCIDEHIQECMG